MAQLAGSGTPLSVHLGAHTNFKTELSKPRKHMREMNVPSLVGRISSLNDRSTFCAGTFFIIEVRECIPC